MLKLYIERCKQRHALAFIQFRRNLPGAPTQQLRDSFDAIKNHLLAILEKVQEFTEGKQKIERTKKTKGGDLMEKKEKFYRKTVKDTIDVKSKIDSFNQVGMLHPFIKGTQMAIDHVKNF